MGNTDSKLAFRKNVFRLYEQQDIAAETDEEAAFWDAFLELPTSSEEVFSLFNAKDVQLVRDKATSNLRTLLDKCVRPFVAIVASSDPVSPEKAKILCNSVRILSRILPFIFELKSIELENSVFWREHGQEAPLGKRLVHLAVKALFLENFTVPQSDASAELVIWRKGVGASTAPASNATLDSNRVEIMRLLLVIVSKMLYTSPTEYYSHENPWFDALECLDKRTVLAVICSLLNTILEYDPVGAGLIPYNYMIFSDQMEAVSTVSLHLLLALLQYPSSFPSATSPTKSGLGSREPSLSSSSTDSRHSEQDGRRHSGNLFRYYISRLHRTEDFEFILSQTVRLLKNPASASATYLPSSLKKVSTISELWYLLFLMLDINKNLLRYLCEKEQVLDVLGAALWSVVNVKSDPSQQFLYRTCLFVIHLLSAEREFAVRLNDAFVDTLGLTKHAKLPPLSPTTTWADILVIISQSLISPGNQMNETVMVILANVSSFIRSLTVASSLKLASLLTTFTNTAFLVSQEHHHRLLFYIIEVINNLLQYHGMSNVHLLYAMLRNGQRIRKVQTLTFDEATKSLEQIRERKSSLTPSVASASAESSTKAQESSESQEKEETTTPAKESSTSTATLPAESWVATEEWFGYWHQRLPLTVLDMLITNFEPKITKFCQENETVGEEEIIEFLKKESLVGLIPPPSPIYIRPFHLTDGLRVWMISSCWGSVYLRWCSVGQAQSGSPWIVPLWTSTDIRLFVVQFV